MEDGRSNNIKVGFIIQARIKSSRLPGKILLPLPISSTTSILDRIIINLKQSTYQYDIVIATSKNKENDIISEKFTTDSVTVYRGDEDDVLSRFIEICKNKAFDVIVRLTADNPFVDIVLLDYLINKHMEEKKSYTCSKNLPLGMNFEIVDPKKIIELETKELSREDKEHVTLYIKNNFPISVNEFKINEFTEKARLTIDYPSDYALASIICELLDNETKPRNTSLLDRIEELFKKNSWLSEINNSNFQKRQFSSEEEEIKEAKNVLQTLEYFNALKKL
jgi:spore coat polysaccharide biosynthesis protein SpsF